jgi:hypothetical protein
VVSSDIVKLDDASWHVDSVPAYIPEEQRNFYAATHFGIFMLWLANKDALIIDDGTSAFYWQNKINEAKNDVISGTQLNEYIGNFKFHTVYIKPEFRPFVIEYYETYLNEYSYLIGSDVYRKDEKKLDSNIIIRLIERRWTEFSKMGSGSFPTRPGSLIFMKWAKTLKSVFPRRGRRNVLP